ncbi:RNA-directed RNA polymerase [ssRNA phage SRR6960551_11]|uniref:RNA-directed RNA polymerase n=1 Tax=ssRNA phage SRR6960551_11 TaxID=2786549 RepID=A0A8S5L0S1_9VIRU|nr:RNA-directed RNA polymerase [ssRNA phage SRR6960551_11]DAD51036.1 TPA_asm: RNA-directed RNA polymerase [ssRNA phage SRR6960551_11]
MRFDADVKRFVLKFLARLDSPMSLRVKLLIDAGEWDELTRLSVDPSAYMDSPWGAFRYFCDAQAVALVKKIPGLPTSFKLDEVARDTFWECEKQCTMSNVVLLRHVDHPVLETAVEQAADAMFSRARRWIARVLGKLPTVLDGRFGPGATYESAEWCRKNIVAYDKLCNIPRCTPLAKSFEDHLVWQTGLRHAWEAVAVDRFIPTVPGNRFTSVAKDSSKNRGICIEPGLNIWAQLAVGGAIRRSLKVVGIDLDHNQTLHRQLACAASLSGRFVTIDLSNASDTICTALVRLLLPDEWHELLDSLRSHKTRVTIKRGKRMVKKWVLLQKFSSMGNGFTFELETLIFSALAHACGGEVGVDSYVYGDDIIVPQEIARDVIAILRYAGFTPNKRKTFVTTAFRESCGGDFLSGFNVRPYFLKEIPNEPDQWIAVANGVWSISSRGLAPDRFTAVRLAAMDHLPSHIRRNRGPTALGDVILHDHPARWTSKLKFQQRWFRCWVPVPSLVRLERFNWEVAMTAAVLGLPSGGLSPRDSVTGHRVRHLRYS